MATIPAAAVNYLDRPGGRIAHDIDGTGPLIVVVPGMGDLRGADRFLAPALRHNGYRGAGTDLRGHGDSDTTFSCYGDVDTAADVVALLEALGGPAIVMGNSMAAGSAVPVAAERPELVGGLVLIGPFVGDPKTDRLHKIILRAAMARPWAATAWEAYLPKPYPYRRPADFDKYRNQVTASIRQPGHTKAFSLTTRTSHAAAEARLRDLTAPTLVIMGEKDPDLADPRAKADWHRPSSSWAKRTRTSPTRAPRPTGSPKHCTGRSSIVPDAGPYPQWLRTHIATPAAVHFADAVNHRA